jgi:uncharacterized protein YcgI (DUF1989 family)
LSEDCSQMAFPLQTVDVEGKHKSSLKTHIVPAAHGYAFEVKKGEEFRIVDLYGEQVVDFAAWVAGTNLVQVRYPVSSVL